MYGIENFAKKIVHDTEALVSFAESMDLTKEEWYIDFQKQMAEILKCSLVFGPCNNCVQNCKYKEND